MRAEVQRHYPHIWQELEGLAQGLEAVDQELPWRSGALNVGWLYDGGRGKRRRRADYRAQ
jgi:hypothetical protein